jgi:YVTN family beta-propeller protein
MGNQRWIGVALAVVAGCATEDERCAPGGAGGQAVDRFAVGSTFALGALERGDGCSEAAWELVEAPAGNLNGIEAGRFTPHVPGVHRFRIAATGEEQRLVAIESAAVPFHNHHYYPGTSIAAVAGAVWTADVYRPTVTAIDPVGGGVATIAVGPWPVAIAWRPGMAHAVVAQRASDDLGLVDVAGQRIVDAIPVGDEPANVVVAADGATAYVALAVSGDVAVVDLATRTVTRRIPLVPDIRALALSPDGRRLYAARLRSRHPVRAPYPDTPIADERDILVVDLATGTIERELLDAGAMIRHLEVSADGAVLYAARLRNDTRGSLAEGEHFIDEIVRFDAVAGAELAAADVGRQASAAGFAPNIQGFAIADGRIWVASESGDLVVALDAVTLEEVERLPAAGRPRAVAVTAAGVHVHGPQDFVVTTVAPGAEAGAARIVATVSTGADPRPPAVARGQRIFTGAGEGYGANHACHSCHAEGATDGQVWKFGRDEYAVPRPQFWLEGTAPLGWPAYLSDVRNFAYGVGPTVGIRPDTAEAEDLGAFLASLMPPPAVNDWTERDGSLSAQAQRGKALFDGAAGCSDCHGGPLFTSRRTIPDGVTVGPRDVPSLVGAYRHGVWFKDGQARTLREAVATMAAWSEAGLDDAQIDDVARYLQELTGRDFFVLTSTAAARFGGDQPLVVTFSLPVWADPANLAHIRLLDAGGAEVAADRSADNRAVTLRPTTALTPGATYRLVVDGALESFDQRRAVADEIAFTVAAAPRAALAGDYRWTIAMPAFDRSGGFDPTRTVPIDIVARAEPTASGAVLTFDLGLGLAYTRHAVIDGDQLVLPAMPVPVGPNLADSRLEVGALADTDGDGRADVVTGTLRLSGPGFDLDGIGWSAQPMAAR